MIPSTGQKPIKNGHITMPTKKDSMALLLNFLNILKREKCKRQKASNKTFGSKSLYIQTQF